MGTHEPRSCDTTPVAARAPATQLFATRSSQVAVVEVYQRPDDETNHVTHRARQGVKIRKSIQSETSYLDGLVKQLEAKSET
jgi:hypothetical protein